MAELFGHFRFPSDSVNRADSPSRLKRAISDLREAWQPILRGTGLGAILGILPGGGAVLASFASYTLEKKIAKDPSRFGAAVMDKRPDLFWGMVASMWIGNAMLLIINLPLIGIWVKLLSMPYRLLYPAILLFCVVGVYSANTDPADLALTAAFALFGYILMKLGCEPAPLVLGFILGPLMEENLRRSLVLSRGSPMIFIERPISAVLLVMTAVAVALIVVPQFRKSREEAFQE